MKPTVLRNKKTGRFLVIEPHSEVYSDWGYDGQDERMTDSTRKYLVVRDSEYPSVLFATNDENLIKILLEKGKSSYPDVRLDFEYNYGKFTLGDLEAVEL